MATNPFFDHVNSPFRHLPLTLVRAAALNARLDEVTAGFDGVKTQLDLKAPLASPTFSGTVTFNTTALSITGGTVTMTAASAVTIPSPGAVSENSSRAATTAWVQALVGSLSVGLPSQATHTGRGLRTDGTSAFWGVTVPTLAGGGADARRVAAVNAAGTDTVWVDRPGANIQIFTSSGTFTPPTNVNRFFVILIGGGGGGDPDFSGAAGGAGGYVWGVATISAPIAVTVGAGGVGGSVATNGGTSSIGSIATAGGGGRGNDNVPGGGGTASTTEPGCIAVPIRQSLNRNGPESFFGSGGPGTGGDAGGGNGNPGIAIFMW